jgi:hypothetical protein
MINSFVEKPPSKQQSQTYVIKFGIAVNNKEEQPENPRFFG